jgi:hypothetical protein
MPAELTHSNKQLRSLASYSNAFQKLDSRVIGELPERRLNNCGWHFL